MIFKKYILVSFPFFYLGRVETARPLPPASVNKNINYTPPDPKISEPKNNDSPVTNVSTTATPKSNNLVVATNNTVCPTCPVCFNCNLAGSKCANGGTCNTQTGRCSDCPAGFGGENCAQPMCQSLANYNRKTLPIGDQSCKCEDGWAGINCNICENDGVCQSYRTDGAAKCVKSSYTSIKSYRQCLVDLPPNLIPGGKIPYVTLDCAAPKGYDKDVDCNFQCKFNTCQFNTHLKDFIVWTGLNEENFYCKFSGCQLSQSSSSQFSYTCPESRCGCISGATLCSTSVVDISPFLDMIKGPVTLECIGNSSCTLQEATLNSFFSGGLPLACNSGECLLPNEIGGFAPSPMSTGGIVAIALASVLGLSLVTYVSMNAVKRQGKKLNQSVDGSVDDEAEKLQESYIPAVLSFKNLQYNLNGRQILNGISGVVKPGEVMAIIGGSGAGKSTCLDILAGKEKKGLINGHPLINGIQLGQSTYRRMVGFVDQEDTLLGTLTVRETLMYSAMLRLPKTMSMEAKKVRVQQTMKELSIEHIADCPVGSSGKRGISGGEKRRVSIAQELVTSPSVLFLDEPTSGLDSYNALLVIETIARLAKDLKRTVVLTIHQPRPMIFSLFDQLLVLATGNMIYSGPAISAAGYFESIGHAVPPQYNTADFLIDLTLKSSEEIVLDEAITSSDSTDGKNYDKIEVSSIREKPSLYENMRRRTSELGKVIFGRGKRNASSLNEQKKAAVVNGRIQSLAKAFKGSAQGKRLLTLVESVASESDATMKDMKRLKSYKIPFMQQFLVLSNRTMMNLYRDPYLIMSHYGVSVIIAIFTGLIFWNVPSDFAGIQNRFGSLFFSLLFFGFVSMTTLDLFAPERLLFIRERANGFYQPFAYFVTKVMFDVIPLRVVPPILFGGICYYMIGLRAGSEAFGTFLFILILFNLAISSMCLIIAISIKQASMGNLVASICMLFCMLFSGFLLNKDNIPVSLGWIIYLSPFYYAFEALAVNEISKVTITDKKLIEFTIPGGVILEQFGFKQGRFGLDVGMLLFMFMVFLTISFLLLKYRVKEQR